MIFLGDENLAQKITDMQAEIERLARKVDQFNGPNVHNDRYTMSLGQPPEVSSPGVPPANTSEPLGNIYTVKTKINTSQDVAYVLPLFS